MEAESAVPEVEESAEVEPSVEAVPELIEVSPFDALREEMDRVVRERNALAKAKAALEQEVEKLRQSRDEALTKWREVSKGYTGLRDEMDSFRVRQQQRADAVLHAKLGDLLKAVFVPVQSLRRAVENPGQDAAVFGQGVAMVLEQFLAVLRDNGFREIPGVGAPFDAELHEPLALVPVQDPAQDGMILAVQDTGYVLGDKVLRVAQVIVGKYEAAVEPVHEVVPPEADAPSEG